jgi:hypothetical protein
MRRRERHVALDRAGPSPRGRVIVAIKSPSCGSSMKGGHNLQNPSEICPLVRWSHPSRSVQVRGHIAGATLPPDPAKFQSGSWCQTPCARCRWGAHAPRHRFAGVFIMSRRVQLELLSKARGWARAGLQGANHIMLQTTSPPSVRAHGESLGLPTGSSGRKTSSMILSWTG